MQTPEELKAWREKWEADSKAHKEALERQAEEARKQRLDEEAARAQYHRDQAKKNKD